MSADAPALSVLACAACGAAVAIAETERARCSHCGADVDVPEAYRAARDVAEREVAADALTRRAFRQLGKRPSWLLRLVDAFSSGAPGLLVTTLFAVLGSAHAIDWALDHWRGWLHVNAWDWLSQSEQQLIWCGLIFSVLLAVYTLGAFGRRHVIGLARLHRALAAHAPARPGGPARCRVCGAPLSVPPAALGVRCAYCHADNLVALPADWLRRARGDVQSVAREAKSALAQHRVEARRLRVRLAVRLGIIATLAALVVTSTVRRVIAGDPSVFDLRAALAGRRVLFDLQPRHVLAGHPGPVAPRIPIDQCADTYVLHRNRDIDCIDGDCFAGWFVALRAGETLALTPGERGTVRLFAHVDNRGWDASFGVADAWGEELQKQSLAPAQPTRLHAPYTSWYRVTLELHQVQSDDVALCAALL